MNKINQLSNEIIKLANELNETINTLEQTNRYEDAIRKINEQLEMFDKRKNNFETGILLESTFDEELEEKVRSIVEGILEKQKEKDKQAERDNETILKIMGHTNATSTSEKEVLDKVGIRILTGESNNEEVQLYAKLMNLKSRLKVLEEQEKALQEALDKAAEKR